MVGSSSASVLGTTQLEQLCESTCRNDLASLQKSIGKACTEKIDVMVPTDGIAYPDLHADFFRATGKYCDVVVAGWASQENFTEAQTCSPCELGLQKIQLASSFGYGETFASAFADTTKSCNAASYAYATPTSYALNTTTAPSSPSCTGSSYIIQENDTTYQLEMTDTCDSLVESWNITFAQLLAWNPMINPPCSNLAAWRGWYLCASPPSGTLQAGQGNVATTAAPVPTDAQPQSNKYCGNWYYFSIALADFYFLNKQVDQKCSNLWANTSYCVRAVGDIATYPGYPVETASTTFTKPPKSTEYNPIPVETPSLHPTASGTIEGCVAYENAMDSTSGLANISEANSCQNWAFAVDATVTDLIEWNPSLSWESCVFQIGKSYCIRRWENAPALNTTCSQIPELLNITISELTNLNPWIGKDCDTGLWSAMSKDGYTQLCVLSASGTTPKPPAETQPGAPANCNKWHVVVSGDGCWAIANEYGITLDEFYTLNPAVGSDCQSLWLGYAVCVGVGT
ncbi:hypothetical protein RRF57_012100 [Xylaria bambusicola]|uniref:LysM domain-containing protein n=1 Tax=Xylaria bambusicola TaxID=326684 RepID=A0AAN7UVY5_9PEZI